MDAWLPEYIKDYKGTSLVIVRTNTVKKLLGQSQECILNSIPVQKLTESQMGVIQKKRVSLKGRLFKIDSLGFFYPKKRVHPDIN